MVQVSPAQERQVDLCADGAADQRSCKLHALPLKGLAVDAAYDVADLHLAAPVGGAILGESRDDEDAVHPPGHLHAHTGSPGGFGEPSPFHFTGTTLGYGIVTDEVTARHLLYCLFQLQYRYSIQRPR